MTDIQMQGQGQTLRSGFFDRNAFRRKSRSILVLKTAVAGLRYHVDPNNKEDRKLLEALTPGAELHLFRDPDNDYDPWAISVFTSEDRELGYVTRFKNETIARLMDQGKVFHAYVDAPAPPPKNEEKDAWRASAPTEDYRLPFSIYMED